MDVDEGGLLGSDRGDHVVIALLNFEDSLPLRVLALEPSFVKLNPNALENADLYQVPRVPSHLNGNSSNFNEREIFEFPRSLNRENRRIEAYKSDFFINLYF